MAADAKTQKVSGTEQKDIILKDETEVECKNKSGKCRNICFTLNNYTEEQFEKIKAMKCKYVVIGKECGASGTNHLQGYIEFANPRSFDSIRKDLFHAHCEARKGTAKQAADYCKKEGKFVEVGKLSAQGSQFHDIVDELAGGATIKDIIHEFPEEYIKYSNGIEKAADVLKPKGVMYTEVKELYPWQKFMIKVINDKVDDRLIYWIVDKAGNHGKTWFCKYVIANFGAAYFNNAKTADIAKAWEGEKIVLFDFCRFNEGGINYQIIESVKNGIVFSAKYGSKTKAFGVPHVVCFSNFEPDRQMLSADRWYILRLKNSVDGA